MIEMVDVDIAGLARAWIEEHKNYREGGATEPGWGYKTLNKLVDVDPSTALSAIEYICKLDSSDPIMEVLAAGPLEDLLSRHGREVGDQLVRVAAANPTFRKLLGGVWRGSIADEIWRKVEELRSSRW
jgi:Family of unknown function (DUF6869)